MQSKPVTSEIYRPDEQLLSDCNVDAPNSDDGETRLHIATRNGYVAAINLLIKHKAKVNITNISGSTALHIATALGFDDIVQLLVDSNANVNLPDGIGRTPLRIAEICLRIDPTPQRYRTIQILEDALEKQNKTT